MATWATRSESEAHLREMIELAECELPIRPETLDANSWAFTVENGTINLRTGKRLPHSRNDLGTRLATVRREEGASCPPGWPSSIASWTATKISSHSCSGPLATVSRVRRENRFSSSCMALDVMARALCSSCSAHCWGIIAQQADFTTFLERRNEGPRNDIARLRGARLVASIEAGEGHRLAEGLVKQLTGGDTIAARFLHAEFFEFRPQFKLWLAANHKPVIRGTDHAIWRRIRLIPFTVTIPGSRP